MSTQETQDKCKEVLVALDGVMGRYMDRRTDRHEPVDWDLVYDMMGVAGLLEMTLQEDAR